MTAPQPAGGPGAGRVPDWPGRPTIDVPGLERPARYCHAVCTLDDLGHRQFLVIASEDGTLPTVDQLTALADGLDELHGDDAPVGSRAWLRDQLTKTRTELERVGRHESTWQRRAEMAEALVRDRSQLTPAQNELERQGLELVRTREAFRERQRRVDALVAERDQLAGRVEELTAIADQARHERDTARKELAVRSAAGQAQADRLVAAADEARAQLREAIGERTEARADLRELGQRLASRVEDEQQLRAENHALRGRLEHSVEARAALLDGWRAEASVARHQRREALRAARRHATAAAATGALTALATALAWTHRTRKDTP